MLTNNFVIFGFFFILIPLELVSWSGIIFRLFFMKIKFFYILLYKNYIFCIYFYIKLIFFVNIFSDFSFFVRKNAQGWDKGMGFSRKVTGSRGIIFTLLVYKFCDTHEKLLSVKKSKRGDSHWTKLYLLLLHPLSILPAWWVRGNGFIVKLLENR